VGLEKGLTMMLRSKNIKAEEGAKSGLIDVLVPSPDAVLPAAKALALEIAAGKQPKVQALKKGDKLPNMMVRLPSALCGHASCLRARVWRWHLRGAVCARQAINFILTTAREEASKARACTHTHNALRIRMHTHQPLTRSHSRTSLTPHPRWRST
jgi:enoyl-CoA hydratase/carnithine racemase